jgi:hypothetical protein
MNNVEVGSDNEGDGSHSYFKAEWMTEVVESWDVAPNVMAMEVNECGLFIGDFSENVSNPMSPAEEELVAEGLRLPTGGMHECACAVQGRAHIVNGTLRNVFDWAAVEDEWGVEYTANAQATAEADYEQAASTMSPQEAEAYSIGNFFGLHSVGCPFHGSGPCLLSDVEDGVRRSLGLDEGGNFSNGYVPLMDNNLLLWTPTLGPLLDAFLRDGVKFYPMKWNTTSSSSSSTQNSQPASPSASATAVANAQTQKEEDGQEIYSVLASPGGKVLVEVASRSSGGRDPALFHAMHHARAVLDSDTSGPFVCLLFKVHTLSSVQQS